MTTITRPAQMWPRTCVFRQPVNARVSAAPFEGSEEVVDLLNDRWLCSLTIPIKSSDDGAVLEAFLGALRGSVNTVNLYHFVRPAPRGTVRGTLTLNAAAAQGAGTLVITGCSPSNGTLLMGDLLGVGGLLVMVAQDATASGGVITVNLTNRLRAAKSGGTSVVWDAPTIPFRLLSTNGVNYLPVSTEEISMDFGEAV